MRVNLLAAARVARTSTLRPRWLLAGRWARVGWQCDTALPARQSRRWDVVTVWAGCTLEEAGGGAQGEVGVDAEVDHQWDKAVGSEDGIAGAEPVVVGHVDPAENWGKLLCASGLDVFCSTVKMESLRT